MSLSLVTNASDSTSVNCLELPVIQLPHPGIILGFLKRIRNGTTADLHKLLLATDVHYAGTMQRLEHMAEQEDPDSMGEANYAMYTLSKALKPPNTQMNQAPRNGSGGPLKKLLQKFPCVTNWRKSAAI